MEGVGRSRYRGVEGHLRVTGCRRSSCAIELRYSAVHMCMCALWRSAPHAPSHTRPSPSPAPSFYKTDAKRVEGKVNVHIVVHSHDDVGWLKTVEQYYYGANNTIQHANVNSIISATILALLEDPARKFIEVEQAFFQRWWAEQTPAKQMQVKQLVSNGQLEFINGGAGWHAWVVVADMACLQGADNNPTPGCPPPSGWSMLDEASPDFASMLDNTFLGQRLIFDAFGVVPKVSVP